jgi:predicted ATPase/DNA-binding SARP family transcriptional activator
MTARIEICVFGPTRARVDDRPVALGGPTARSFLAALVAAGPQGASTDSLIATVWGDAPPPTARKSVQKYVSRLRSHLSRDLVQSTPVGYRLRTGDGVELDIDRFRRLVEEAGAAAGRGEVATAVARYDAAFEVASVGEPFSELDDRDLAGPLAARLCDEVAAAIERTVGLLLELGRTEEAIGRAEDLIAAEPMRESAWALLVTGLYQANRQSDALRAYRRIQLRLAEELGIEPSPELRRLEQEVLHHTLAVPARSRPPNRTLPVAYTSFVGRRRELDELRRLLGMSRLVTVTGPGGSGKTRLAMEAATPMAADRPVTFVDLAPVADAARVPTAFSAALGMAPGPNEDPTAVLPAHLQARAGLLVVDNCEHVAGATASLVHRLLSCVGDLTVLATSREPLGLTGEVVYVLHPLPIPPATITTPAAALAYDAVRLFDRRARAAAPGFVLDGCTAEVVAICRGLDGIPLAIELAARQLSSRDLTEIHRGIQHGIDHLTAPGDPDPRHRTVSAAIEWSFRLLDPDQQSFFLALTVFPGSFAREAAGRLWELLGGDGDPDRHLDRLVAHSMVLRLPAGDRSRFRLLEPLRAWGAGRARDRFPAEALARAHARWVLELLRAHEPILGPDERRSLRALRAEDHHLPVALRWAIDRQPELALHLAVAATSYISMTSYRFSWFDDLQAAIAAGRSSEPGLRHRALAHVGFSLAENFADHQVSSGYARAALAHARATDDPDLEVLALLTLAGAAKNAGHLDEAVARYGDVIGRADATGATVWAIWARRWLAFTDMQRGEYTSALATIRTAQALGERIGSDWVTAKTLWLTAAVLALEGEYGRAEEAAARSFALFDGFDDPASPLHVRAVQGDAARLSGDHHRAASIYRQCLHGFGEVGDRRCAASTLRNLGLTLLHLGHLEEARGHLLDALRRREGFGDDAGVAECLEGLALLSSRSGGARRAVTLFAAADALRERSGSVPPAPERREVAATLGDAQAQLGPPAAEDAWSAGRTLSTAAGLVGLVEALVAGSPGRDGLG